MPEKEAEGLKSFQEAVDAARVAATEAEGGDTEEVEGEAPETDSAFEGIADDQASEEDTEQPEVEAEAESVFGDVADELTDEVDIMSTEVVLKVGDEEETHTVGDLADGFLRQADYTRKTQALASERGQFEEESAQAVKLMDAMRTDPAGTVAALAIELGLITKDAVSTQQVADLNEVYQVPDRETMQSQIEARAAELAAESPEILEAKRQAAMVEIEQEVTDLQEEFEVQFTADDRTLLYEEAVKLDTSNLRVAYLSLADKATRARKARAKAVSAAPARGGVSKGAEPDESEKDDYGDKPTFAQAAERARKKRAAQSHQ